MHALIITDTMLFLSTLSLRRATVLMMEEDMMFEISIHALLAESDPAAKNRSPRVKNFYPRSPCGERRVFNLFASPGSTISIHALLAESDIHIRVPSQRHE